MSLTTLEAAAELRAQLQRTKEAISRVKDAGGDWTTFQLMADELNNVADSAIRGAWGALQRLEQLAKELKE